MNLRSFTCLSEKLYRVHYWNPRFNEQKLNILNSRICFHFCQLNERSWRNIWWSIKSYGKYHADKELNLLVNDVKLFVFWYTFWYRSMYLGLSSLDLYPTSAFVLILLIFVYLCVIRVLPLYKALSKVEKLTTRNHTKY